MHEGLGAWLDRFGHARGPAPALVADGDTVSFDRLARESRQVAGALARLGIGRGDRVAFWLPNVPAYVTLFFACARLIIRPAPWQAVPNVSVIAPSAPSSRNE